MNKGRAAETADGAASRRSLGDYNAGVNELPARLQRRVWACIVFTLVSVFVLLRLVFWPGPQDAGPFHREHLESVVQRIRGFGVPAGQSRHFRLDRLDDPRSLRDRRPEDPLGSGLGEGDVDARRQPDGSLVVVIQTRDHGHAGRYGFAYTEVPQNGTAVDNGWFLLDLPGYWIVRPPMRVDRHWWRVTSPG